MAYALSNDSGFNFTAKLHEVAQAWKAHRAKREIFNRTYSELASLSDRDLTDIGISRDQIRDVAWQGAEKSV